ncbi:hypothetical protein GCM10023334_050540 [Nonomuraea thailandensis]
MCALRHDSPVQYQLSRLPAGDAHVVDSARYAARFVGNPQKADRARDGGRQPNDPYHAAQPQVEAVFGGS